MSKTVTATEANQNFSRLLRDAAAGGTVVITPRGKPAVSMRKVGDADGIARQAQAFGTALEQLRKLPRIAGGPWRRSDLYE